MYLKAHHNANRKQSLSKQQQKEGKERVVNFITSVSSGYKELKY